WLWVQLSGYGYSRWGAPYRLGCALARLRRKMPNVRLAVYLHETHCWPRQLGIKGPLLSPWQKYTVGRIARMADLVFTSNQHWQRVALHDYHVEPHKLVLLPIGSNIPRADLTAEARASLRRSLNWGEREIVAVTFGSYGFQLLALQRFKDLLLQGLSNKTLDRVVCLGGERPAIPSQFESWKSFFGNPDVFQILGPRPAPEVGQILECCDFAFNATPKSVLEKSGSFIAAANAGLGVLVHSDHSNGGACDHALPVLAAESWNWCDALLPQTTLMRRALQEHARANYAWDTIARRALAVLTLT